MAFFLKDRGPGISTSEVHITGWVGWRPGHLIGWPDKHRKV